MSSLDLEHDEVDEVLPPARPAPLQHLETPAQRLERMLRQHATLIHQHAHATDADERERMLRLIRHREIGIEYQRGVVAGLGK